jgi:hypothetical protein
MVVELSDTVELVDVRTHEGRSVAPEGDPVIEQVNDKVPVYREFAVVFTVTVELVVPPGAIVAGDAAPAEIAYVPLATVVPVTVTFTTVTCVMLPDTPVTLIP